MIVVGGGDLHNPPKVLAHLGWGARVGLVTDPQLALAVGAPVVQDALVVDTFLSVDWLVVVPDLICP